MSLEKKINEDIKKAMLAKDQRKLSALRAVKSAILLAKTDKGVRDAEISEQAEMNLLQKLVKQRKESAGTYQQQNRQELADEELYQAEVIEKYLPAQMSDEELRQKIDEIIEQTGASNIKDMGKVMGAATSKLAGKADNKRIAAIVKERLG